uniref:Cadherin domain-containing protein n=1 Tax=Gouania willdenowi TaxID=441366 RepID=A0A8C5ER87_GOUWI
MQNGNNDDLFSISPNGSFEVSHSLDREKNSLYIITVTAVDSGNYTDRHRFFNINRDKLHIYGIVSFKGLPSLTGTLTFVRFQNSSDFPRLNVEIVHFSLSEDEPVGTLVAVISAASSRAEPISFYLASGNFEDVFLVEQTSGAVLLEKPLDYENRKDFPLLVEARDAGSPPFSSFAEVYLNISDVNDNAPQFTQGEYQCNVFENSPPSIFCDVLAVDADSDIYGMVVYRITEGNSEDIFSVDPENGLLSTTSSLDREHIAEFNLTIEAAELENPQNKDTTTVVVTVLDKNDNPPHFTQVFYIEVTEDIPPGHTVSQITTSDDDTGANTLTYSIVDENEDLPFYIDLTTGFITVVLPLDREEHDHYVFKVVVNDSAWSVSTDVTVTILDVNDNKPEFSHAFYNVVFPETRDEEVLVLQVIATDADVGKNAEILYLVEPSNVEFWVNSSTGEIYTKHRVILKVLAKNAGVITEMNTDEALVHINVINTNDAPIFSSTRYLANISEDSSIGTSVVKVSALDQDSFSDWSRFFFSIASGNTELSFTIDASSGVVSVNSRLDRELCSIYHLTITATDNGSPPATGTTDVIVTIVDVNDNAPMLISTLAEVKENQPQGTIIKKLKKKTIILFKDSITIQWKKQC